MKYRFLDAALFIYLLAYLDSKIRTQLRLNLNLNPFFKHCQFSFPASYRLNFINIVDLIHSYCP